MTRRVHLLGISYGCNHSFDCIIYRPFISNDSCQLELVEEMIWLQTIMELPQSIEKPMKDSKAEARTFWQEQATCLRTHQLRLVAWS